MSFLLALIAFLAGAYYAHHDWARVTVITIVGLLIWTVRDELRGGRA